MPEGLLLFLAALGFLLLSMTALWLVSLRLRDASIIDLFWGPAFVGIATLGYLAGGYPHPRARLAMVMAILWASRLSLYLGWRNLGHGEDRRYRAMRKHRGQIFWWWSLPSIFWLQATLACLVGLPLVAVMTHSQVALGWLDGLALGLWLVGLSWETFADLQLARFLARPRRKDAVLDRGLWRYSRHPNYFGDFLVWWGFGLLALAAGAGWALAGPLLMSILLMRVSGVSLLESDIQQRRPAYARYVAQTPAFFPRWKRSAAVTSAEAHL